MTLSTVHTLLDEAVQRGDPPAACACVIRDRNIAHESAHAATLDSVFDIASITKVAATTLAIATLIRDGELELDADVSRWLPEMRGITVRELLGHRSGLPAWRPFFATVMSELPALFGGAPEREAWPRARAIVVDQLLLERPGERRRVYSDLGFIALGVLIEAATGERLDAYVTRAVHAPLGLEGDLGFVDLSQPTHWIDDRHVLATGRTRPREPAPGQEHLFRVPPQPLSDDAGRVDDDNAFALGGVAGHAGLFGTARAVAKIGAAILAELDGTGSLGLGEVLHTFAAPDGALEPLRGLGFDRAAPEGSSAGSRFGQPRGAIGHLGFTGCSLWIDLDRRVSAALLTNRTLPGRANVEGIRALRPAFYDAIVDAI